MLTDARIARIVAVLLPCLTLYCFAQTFVYFKKAMAGVSNAVEVGWLVFGWILATGEWTARHPALYLSLWFLLAVAAILFYLHQQNRIVWD